ncbi:MAG: hypothetical protein ABI972_21370 [Acidobacteriota bacterium]
MKITTAAILLCAAALAAQAQTFSTPVRNVNDPTHSPMTASCTIQFSTIGLGTCPLYTVPAGKRLSVREIAVTCSTDLTGSVSYGLLSSSTAAPSAENLVAVPSNFPNAKWSAGARQVFFQSLAGPVEAKVWLAAGVPSTSNCSVSIQGYLVDQQP